MLIGEDDLPAINGRHRIDAQREVAFVALVAGWSREQQRPIPDRTRHRDDVPVDDDRIDQNELEGRAGFAFVRRRRRRQMKSDVRSGRNLGAGLIRNAGG